MWSNAVQRGTPPLGHILATIGAHILGDCWAKARENIARLTLTIRLDGYWSSLRPERAREKEREREREREREKERKRERKREKEREKG